MSAGKQVDPRTDTVADGIVRELALFVTFYVHRDKAQPLYERLRFLAKQVPEAFPKGRQDSIAEPLVGTRDVGAAAYDAAAIRLILNTDDDDVVAWERVQLQLKKMLDDPVLPAEWWGYTVVYQGIFDERVDAETALRELLPAVRRPNSSESLQRSLAKADVSGGRVWLMDLPIRGDGTAAATVLVALSPSTEEQVFKRALFGTTLSMADLIAHKGYAIRREYRGERQRAYKNKLTAFWGHADGLLEDLGGRIKGPGKLNEVATWYGSLTSVVSLFERMSISMAQQLQNYEQWRIQAHGNEVVEYHCGPLQTANRELEMLVAEGREALEVADKALSLARVELDNRAQESRQLIEYLLAVVGSALAVPELVNQKAAKALLSWFGWADTNLFVAFLTQLGAIVVTAILIIVLIRLLNRRQSRSGNLE
jgi:hypothetical protein